MKKSIPILSIFICSLLPLTVRAQAKVTKFKLWSWIPNLERPYFNWAATEFNKENPQTPVSITYQKVGFDDLRVKLIKDFGDDSDLPDIIAIESRQWPYYEAEKPGKYLIDLSDIYQQHSSQLFNSARFDFVHAKKHYALSWQMAPMIFVYNKKAFNKFGIPYPLKTWSDFKSAATKAHNAGKKLALMEVRDPQIFYGLFLERGGKIYDENGNFVFPKYASQAKEVFRLLKSLHDEAGLGGETLNDFLNGKYNKQFAQHKIIGIVGGDWILMIIKKILPEESGQWRIQAIPTWSDGGFQGVTLGGNGYAIVKKETRSPGTEKLLKKFLAYATLSLHMQTMYFKKWNFQMSNKILFSRVYAMMYKDPYLGGQQTMMTLSNEITHLAPRNPGPGVANFLDELYDIQNKYIDGTISLNKAISELSKNPG